MIRQSMKIGFSLLLVIGALSVLEPAWSQEVTAGIVGTVVDPSEAPIKDATVTATDTQRGTVRTVNTNDAGAYNITRVPVGIYDVKVSAPGFQTAVHPALTLVLNQTARIDVQMKMGQVTRRILLRLSKRSLMKRRTTDLGTHGSMAWACSGRFVNALSTIKPATCSRAARSMATAAPSDQPATTI